MVLIPKTNLFYCLLLVLLVSCKTGSNRVDFPETENTTTSQLSLDGVYMTMPYRIRIADTLFYVTDLHATDFFCHSYTYTEIKHVQSFAKKGKAPDELLSVGNIHVGNNGKLYLLDVFGKKVYSWNDKQIVLETSLPADIAMTLDFALYNDTTYIVPDFTGENRLVFINRNGAIIRKEGTIPTTEHSSVPRTVLGQAWRPFLHYNPKNGICALVTQLGDVLEIYDLKNGETHVTMGSEGEPKFRMNGSAASPDGIMGYGDVFVGDKYIYAVFWGHQMDDIKSGKINVQGGDLFRVFDLKGKPIKQYKLDNYLMGFCVNEETGEVIGTDANNEQLVIFEL